MFVQIGIAIQHLSTMAYLEASLEASSLKEAETFPLTDSMIFTPDGHDSLLILTLFFLTLNGLTPHYAAVLVPTLLPSSPGDIGN